MLLAWLGGVLVFVQTAAPGALAALLDARFLRGCERALRKLIFARAALALGERVAPQRGAHPLRAQPGFKLSGDTCSALRLMTRNLLPKLAHASPSQRIARIAHVIANLAAFVRRALKRIAKGFVRVRLVGARPPARAFICAAPALCAASADTS
jgi:hypothetical protein